MLFSLYDQEGLENKAPDLGKDGKFTNTKVKCRFWRQTKLETTLYVQTYVNVCTICSTTSWNVHKLLFWSKACYHLSILFQKWLILLSFLMVLIMLAAALLTLIETVNGRTNSFKRTTTNDLAKINSLYDSLKARSKFSRG